MVTNHRGMSLVELLMGVSIMGFVLYAAASLLVQSQKNTSAMERKLLQSQDSLLLETLLKRTMSFSNFRVYALNGSTAANTAFSRFIYPQNGVCADLSQNTACQASTSLIYATLDSKDTITTQAYCWINEGTQLMVNSEMEGLLSSSPLVALTFPPVASLWTIQGSPRSVNMDSLPPECFLHLDRSGGNYVTSNRRVIDVRSFFIPGSSGSPSPAVRTKMAVNFPLDINRVKLYAVGLIPFEQQSAFALQGCQWRQNTLRCQENLLTMKGIQRVHLIKAFKNKLNPDSAAQRFQIVGGSVQRDTSCSNPSCLTMRLPDNSPIPYALSGESLEQMNPARFSAIKQEILRRIDFLLTDTEGRKSSVSMALD